MRRWLGATMLLLALAGSAVQAEAQESAFPAMPLDEYLRRSRGSR